jgi:hypothetical protein
MIPPQCGIDTIGACPRTLPLLITSMIFWSVFLKDSSTTIEFVRFERPLAWESVGRSRRLDAKAEGRVSATEDGARLLMRMELRPKGTLRLLLPIIGRFMHKQEERNLAAIKGALETPGASAARRGA